EAKEDGETVLYAVNSREYDGQSEHIHTDELVDKGDSRLVSYKLFTPENTLTQEVRSVTQNMIKSASGGDSSLFGLSAGLPLFIIGSGLASTTLEASNQVSGSNDNSMQPDSLQTAQDTNTNSTFSISDLSKNTLIAEDTILRINIDDLLKTNANSTSQTNLHLTNISDTVNGSIKIEGNEIVFTPNANYNGEAGFVYTVVNSEGIETKSAVGMSFAPTNDTPIVNDELIMGKRNINYIITVDALLSNDTDIETPDNISILRIQNVQHGEAIFDGKTVKFIPETDYPGLGSFEYVVVDKHGGESVGVAQIDLSHINENPIATDDSFDGFEDTPFIITQDQLMINDSDPDAWQFSHLSVDEVRNASHGTVSIQADGSIRYTPDANYNGSASFEYRLSDNEGGYAWATATLNVQAVNDAPIIEDVLYGRPIYGYGWLIVGYDEDSPIFGYREATWQEAISLSYNNALYASKYDNRDYDAPISSLSYYRNGMPRPIAIDYNDSLRDTGWDGQSDPYDDEYRQSGMVIAYDIDSPQSSLTYSIGAYPIHGHAWANQYVSYSEPNSIQYTEVRSWVGETASYQYYSHYGDSYNGSDPFTIRVTDDQGTYTDVSINAYHTGTNISGGGGGKKPVSLDLTGNGLSFLNMDDSNVYFDVNKDDWREHIAWVSPDDGLLALDIDGDRVIKSIEEISFVGYKEGARTDLEGLQAFDSNHDGILSKLDERWAEFGVWQDKNSNGISETGEFTTLDDRGISSINLTSDQVQQQVGDTTLFGTASYTTNDGTTYAVGDVAFKYDANDKIASNATNPEQNSSSVNTSNTITTIEQTNVSLQANTTTSVNSEITQTIQASQIATSDVNSYNNTSSEQLTDADTAKIIQMAAIFNQMMATSNTDNSQPLGYIDSGQTSMDITQQVQEAIYTESRGVNG
ncbi:MAG: tandem-95 repeat protein, partial [Campylobacterales bacterium]|nr:tandem-95 repeat protein [Campylobacterales bacterium]